MQIPQLIRNVLNRKPTIQEKEMEAQVMNEPAVEEEGSKADRAARQHFEKREHIQLLAVIEKKGNEPSADVSIYERALGRRISVTVPANEYLERGVQELAARYSNARLETIHI